MPRPKGSKNKPRESVASGHVKGAEIPIRQAAAANPIVYQNLGEQPTQEFAPPKPMRDGYADQPMSLTALVDDDPSPRLPMRKLWELAHTYGAPVKNRYDREELERSLAQVGYEPDAPNVENVNDYWKFSSRYAGKGPITAVDPNGNWTATVFQDGRCEILEHVAPNLHSRIPGVRYHDNLIKISNLEDFATRLVLLINESDVIFDETVDQLLSEEAAEVARLSEEPQIVIPGHGSIHGADPRIDQMTELCEYFGFVGAVKPALPQMPKKLAEALGVPLKGEDGEEKNWSVLADEVLEKAELLDREEPEMRGPAYGRNAEEPVMVHRA